MKIASFDVRLGSASSEVVRKERRQFHEWLCTIVSGRCEIPDNISPKSTIFLSEADIQYHPSKVYSLIHKQLDRLSKGDQVDCVVLDLAGNAYELLRDSVLFHFAQTAYSLHVKGATTGICILLPRFPPEASLFWDGLPAKDTQSTFCVLSTQGEWRWFGSKKRNRPSGFVLQMGQAYRAVTGDVIEVLRMKLLRRLGHFQRKTHGISKCSRYFFDAGNCVAELRMMFQQRIEAAVAEGVIQAPSALLVHGPMSPWLREAGLALGAELKVEVFDVSHRLPGSVVPSGALLLSDLVDTGSTLQDLLLAFEDSGIFLQTRILCAMGRLERVTMRPGDGAYTIECLLVVEPNAVPSESCEQCQLHVPFSSLSSDEPFQISSFDMWWMFLRVPWIQERDTPPDLETLGLLPDMNALFEEFGDWLAYKIEQLLRHEGCAEGMVIVSPNEAGSSTLLSALRLRFDSRLVPVLIPREILTRARDLTIPRLRDMLADLNGDDVENSWLRQLHGISMDCNEVVVMDEFSASGGTLRAISRILCALDIPIFALFPILNRVPQEIHGMKERILSLYRIESPRPASGL